MLKDKSMAVIKRLIVFIVINAYILIIKSKMYNSYEAAKLLKLIMTNAGI